MWYIQRRDGRDLETIDEFETFKEAREMRKEYQISDSSVHYYVSSRCCKHWRESE